MLNLVELHGARTCGEGSCLDVPEVWLRLGAGPLRSQPFSLGILSNGARSWVHDEINENLESFVLAYVIVLERG